MKKSSTHCKPHYAPEALKGKDENKNKQGKFYAQLCLFQPQFA